MGRAELHLRAAVKYVLNHRGERETIRRGYIFRLLKRWTPVIAVEGQAGTYAVPTAGGVLARETFARRGFDESKLARAVELADPAAGSSFLDVGANVGVTTVPALNRYGFDRAVAVEPSPGNLRLLRATLAMNDLADRVEVVPAALSEMEGEMELELADENWGDHRLRVTAEPGAFYEENRRTVSVRVTTLDAVAPPNAGMVWIDTQGHEAQVLAGGSRLLSSGVPVVIEFWPYGLKRSRGIPLLYELVARYFSEIVDLGDGSVHSAGSMPSLGDRYADSSTDLLLR